MSRQLLALLLLTAGMPPAQAMEPLDDVALGEISGGDGIAALILLDLNIGQIAWGTNVDLGTGEGPKTTHLVFNNFGGSLLLPITLDIEDGGANSDYLNIKFPLPIKFTNWSFGAMSVRTDPNVAPACGATCGLGSFEINGNLEIAGSLRIWAH